MDAAHLARMEKKKRLLEQFAELLVEEERAKGTFVQVPHYSLLERAARELGREVSRTAQRRAAAEVAATQEATATCPTCGGECRTLTRSREVKSVDGPVELIEPTAHCPACRRDFFPSA